MANYEIPKSVKCPNCGHEFPFPLRTRIMALILHLWQKVTGRILLTDHELKRWLPW